MGGVFIRPGRFSPAHNELYKQLTAKVNKEKYECISALAEEKLNFLVSELLPRIFHSYESNPMSSFRFRALQICEKIIAMLSE